MMQLVYLYFTSPRKDNDAFLSFVQRQETALKNQEAEPMIAFNDSINSAIYGDNPLAKRLRAEDIKKLDYDKVITMYKQLYFNPGSFVFTFVGNINEDEVKPVIEQYLASLPGEAVEGEFIKVPMDFEKGNLENIFNREMQNPKASVFNTVTGNVERTLKNQILMSMFDQILDIVYTEKVREEEGGTYGVQSGGSISRYPEGQTILQIMFDTDPERMAHLNSIVLRELKLIASEGPREGDFSKVKEYMNKSYDENLKENRYWLNTLNTKHFYSEDNHTKYLETVNSITANDIKEFASNLLENGDLKTIVMLPEVKE